MASASRPPRAGSKRANVDFLLVGPGGVVVVDVKAWRALEVPGASRYCDDDCRDDEVSKLLSLADRVQDSVGLLGLTPHALTAALVSPYCDSKRRPVAMSLLALGAVGGVIGICVETGTERLLIRRSLRKIPIKREEGTAEASND